jgi:hypothetical protein
MTISVTDARKLLDLRMSQAFGHTQDLKGPTHHHLNVRGFMDALDQYIDLKIKEANAQTRPGPKAR